MKKTLFILSILLVTFFSCTNEDLLYLDDIEDAAFIRFTTQPDATVGVNDPADVVYAGELIASGPVASYALEIYADLSGVRTDTFAVETYTSFPINLNLTASDIATLLGVTTDDFSFGDKFYFEGTVTSTSGVVYYGEAPVYDLGDDDVDPSDDTYEPNGNVDEQVYDAGNGYKDGYLFDFQIGCPTTSLTDEAIVGDYVYTDHYGGESNCTIYADADVEFRYWVIGMYSGWGYPIPNEVYFDVDPVTLIAFAPRQDVGVPDFFGFADLAWTWQGQTFPCSTKVVDGIEDMLFGGGSLGDGQGIFEPVVK